MIRLEPICHLSEAEQRGAMIALEHVRGTATRMQRNARGQGSVGLSVDERQRLALAAQAVELAVDITRRELSPALKPWHVAP